METDSKPEEQKAKTLGKPWRDATSNLPKDGLPRTWVADFGAFRLVLTRHINYEPDQWTAYCSGVFQQRAMASKDVGEAACQAKAILQVALETALAAILEGVTSKSTMS